MILVVSVCKNRLAEHEFVRPVTDILKDEGQEYRVTHYSRLSRGDLADADKIIICGTQLRDNEYLEHVNKFSWVRGNTTPLLGICAGMQVISLAFGGKLVPEKPEIGMTDVTVTRDTPLVSAGKLKAYALHNLSVTVPESFLKIAESGKCVHGIMHKELPIYGFLFHPEVRNKEVIKRFSRV